jgi:type I restriction enzyme R subunit
MDNRRENVASDVHENRQPFDCCRNQTPRRGGREGQVAQGEEAMSNQFTESVVEDAALEWFGELGYSIVHGPEIAPGEPAAERESYEQFILEGRLRDALACLNPDVPQEGLDEAFRKVSRISSPQLVDANHEFHYYLVNGVSVEYLRSDGSIGYDPVRLVDFDVPDNNDWLVVNRHRGWTHPSPRCGGPRQRLAAGRDRAQERGERERHHLERLYAAPDLQEEIPGLFTFNEALIVSDGLDARIGTLSAHKERFSPWRTIEGEDLALPLSWRLCGGAFPQMSGERACRVLLTTSPMA